MVIPYAAGMNNVGSDTSNALVGGLRAGLQYREVRDLADYRRRYLDLQQQQGQELADYHRQQTELDQGKAQVEKVGKQVSWMMDIAGKASPKERVALLNAIGPANFDTTEGTARWDHLQELVAGPEFKTFMGTYAPMLQKRHMSVGEAYDFYLRDPKGFADALKESGDDARAELAYQKPEAYKPGEVPYSAPLPDNVTAANTPNAITSQPLPPPGERVMPAGPAEPKPTEFGKQREHDIAGYVKADIEKLSSMQEQLQALAAGNAALGNEDYGGWELWKADNPGIARTLGLDMSKVGNIQEARTQYGRAALAVVRQLPGPLSDKDQAFIAGLGSNPEMNATTRARVVEIAKGKLALQQQYVTELQEKARQVGKDGYTADQFDSDRTALQQRIFGTSTSSQTQSRDTAAQSGTGGPKVGDVVGGYEYTGGDPRSPRSWKKR